MKLNLEIKNEEVYSIYYAKRQLYAFYKHYIYSFDLTNIKPRMPDDIKVERITPDNVSLCERGPYHVPRMIKYLKEQPDFVDGFLFFDKISGKLLGFRWIMYKGGNEFQYRIRKTDAFFFDDYVVEECRGRGIYGKMYQWLFHYLKYEKGCKNACLAVRRNNKSAIRADEKAGGIITAKPNFIQIFRRYNIPYYKV